MSEVRFLATEKKPEVMCPVSVVMESGRAVNLCASSTKYDRQITMANMRQRRDYGAFLIRIGTGYIANNPGQNMRFQWDLLSFPMKKVG
jgi:hypothetical protein